MPNWTDVPERAAVEWRFNWTGDLDELPQEQLDELDAELDAERRGTAPMASEWD